MKKTKIIAVMLCMGLFAAMALGSGSDSGDKKDITSSNQNASGEDVTIDEQVLVDEQGIKITANGYETDSLLGDGVKLLIENNSDKNVTVGCNALIVNNYMIYDFLSEDVAAGKKVNATMYLSSSELKAAGIENIGQIEVYFTILDSSSFENIFDPAPVTIKTSLFDKMDTTANDEGTELYNKDGIKIVGKAVDENSFWGSAVLLYVENNSDRNVTVQCDNMSINGYMITPLFSCDVYSGKKSVDAISILSSELENNNIESIEDVELTFKIFDSKTFSQIDESDTITFKAQ